MDSDSDSDGSHISATPPRDLKPSPPSPTFRSSKKSRVGVRVSSHSSAVPESKTQKFRAKSLDPIAKTPEQEDLLLNPPPPVDFLNLPGSSIQIRRPFNRNHAGSAIDTVENLPARHISNSAFFTKIRQRPSLDPESVQDSPPIPSASISQPEIGGEGSVDLIPTEASNSGFHVGDSKKVVRKYPNLIGGDVHPLPLKQPKCVREGNFVRLNINGYGRKFSNKCGKRRSSSSYQSRRPFRRSKGKPKTRGETETDSLCGEEVLLSEIPEQQQSVKPKFGVELIEAAILAARCKPSDENLLKLVKLTHGYDSFRDGQLEAIKQVVVGQSTMLVLPTGAGKSLCYQLPALLLPGITLVVSPLVALMIDQIRQLPPLIQGGLLCSSQTSEEVSGTLQRLQEGHIKVLFVSPERLLNQEFVSIFDTTVPISLLVVDEAHCISEWSHNFRPSYLRLRASLLSEKLNVRCILAMTATATVKTLHDVMCALEIPETSLIQTAHIRENLQMNVIMSTNRMKDLMMLIKSHPFTEIQSIIIYCKFQSETELLSKYLCDNNVSAKSYHSGIPTRDRQRTQELFCSNKIRVVVATVAFGMGLDKGDVGAVIHYSLPESLEEYVQEIGRAGRDGRLSYCHLLFDDNTYFKLRSLSYSDGVDEYAINRLLSQVFSNSTSSPGKICSLIRESTSRKADMKEEVILTVLTYLELGDVKYLRLLPQINVTCTINFHKTSPVLLAGKDIVVAAILKCSETKHGNYVYDIPTVANSIGISTFKLSNHLQSLKSKGEVTYEMKDPAFCYTIVEDPGDLCSLAACLTRWLSEVESCKVRKLDAMFSVVTFAAKVCEKTNGCSGTLHTPCLQRKILDYFCGDDNSAQCDIGNKMVQSSRFLRADIKVFLQGNSHIKFTPRAVARILHGIGSPVYPSTTWSRTHFWGRYSPIDFPIVMEAAKLELMNFVGKDVP